MNHVIEIVAVASAFTILVLAGWALVRSVMGFGRTVKMAREHGQSQVMALMSQSEMAQQRVFSITSNADALQRKVYTLRVASGRMLVIIKAFREASENVSRLMGKLGF